METREELLDRFARMIDLPAFVAQQGFRLSDRQEPSRLSMTLPSTGETLLLEKDVVRGGWTYVNARDPKERGTVADLLVRREGATREACLERLIACADERRRDSPEATRYRTYLREMPDELRQAERAHEQVKLAEHAAAKALERLGVSRATFDEWRFGPPRNESDVAKLAGEPKALWGSCYRPTDKAVVLVERPIDAIAYERAHGNQSVCYLATGTRPDDAEKKRLANLLAQVPDSVRVVLAYGRDQAGRRVADEVRALVPAMRMERHAPELGARWADRLQLEQRHGISLRRNRGGLER
jgi:Toprim-like